MPPGRWRGIDTRPPDRGFDAADRINVSNANRRVESRVTGGATRLAGAAPAFAQRQVHLASSAGNSGTTGGGGGFDRGMFSPVAALYGLVRRPSAFFVKNAAMGRGRPA
jgi:hypothetical protein